MSGGMADPVVLERRAVCSAGGILVLLLQTEARFGVREYTLIAAGEPDLAAGSMRHLSTRLVYCL